MTRFVAVAAPALLAFAVSAAEKKKPPPPEVPLPPVDQLPLPTIPTEQKPAAQKPPIVAPAVPPAGRIGVGVSGDLDVAAAARLTTSLRSIAVLAPLAREAIALRAEGCEADACAMALGAAQQVDRVLFARLSGGVLAVRVLDPAGVKPAAEAKQPAPADAAELRAAAESLACGLLVPAGCSGEAHIEAAGAAIEIDGKPAAARTALPVGVHALAIRSGDSVVRRTLPVVSEKPVVMTLRREQGKPLLLTPDEVAQRAVVSAEVPAPARTRWTRTAGYVAAGAGIVAAGAAVFEGLHSRSLINDAESGYRANGNVYRPNDLSNLESGNSAARTANVLFAASGVLLASGLLLAFAF